MPLHDHGTVRVYASDDQVDIFFPAGDTEMRQLLSGFKARWMPERKCWRAVPKFAGASAERITGEVRSLLIARAPEGWEQALPKISQVNCVTRKFGLVIGAGGMRITLPPGHSSDHALKSVSGAKKDGEHWLVPAAICMSPEMKPIIARMLKEDRESFDDMMEYVERRSISGLLTLDDRGLPEYGISEGASVFADLSFMKSADPQIPSGPIREYALKVVSLESAEDGYSARLDYLPAAEAYRLSRIRVGAQDGQRLPALNMSHVRGKWSYKRIKLSSQ